MNRTKELVEEKSFNYEEFNVTAEVHKVKFSGGYEAKKRASIYAIDLEFKDTTSKNTYNTKKTIPVTKIKEVNKYSILFRQILKLDTEFYDSIYDFTIDSVITGAREARDNLIEQDVRQQSEQAQIDKAFESLKQV